MKKNDKNKYVAVLSGAIIKDKTSGRWRTANFDEGDNFGVSGDRLRIIAAAYLYQANPDLIFITSGGQGQTRRAPDMSGIIKGELIEAGIPADKIMEESRSANTYQQLKELIKLARSKRLEGFLIISNFHHLPRIKAMFEYAPGLPGRLGGIKLIAAEKIVLKYEPEKWQAKIKTAQASAAMKKRIELEKKGVRQIKNGTYNFR